jgi:hypothetical protein
VVSITICLQITFVVPLLPKIAGMAAVGGGRKGEGSDHPGPDVSDLLSRLNLTKEEGAVADFCDDEDDVVLPTMEWALVGKILSPMAVHINTVCSAMKPAWGNPAGLKL